MSKISRPKKPKKRSRADTENEDTDSSSSSSSMPVTPLANHGPRNIAGTRRVSISQQTNSPTSPIESPVNYLLPMYSNDLARLPVYGQFNFADTATANAVLGSAHSGQIPNPTPAEHSSSYHFDQVPNPAMLSLMGGDDASHFFPSSDDFILDSMFKDAAFSSSMVIPTSPKAASADVSAPATQAALSDIPGTTTAVRALPSLTPSEVATLFAHCSTDFGAFAQQLPSAQQQPMIDHEMLKMWSTAPASLEYVKIQTMQFGDCC